MLVHRYRLPAAVIGAAIAAGGATLLLRPRAVVTDPAAASAGDYFTPQQLERAHDFRAPQRTVFLTSLVLDTAALVLLVARPARVLTRLGRQPAAGAAAAGAGLSVGMTVIGLPLSMLS